MAFNLPLPSIQDVSVQHQMAGLNALQKQNLENRYYGPAQAANIAAKTTYAQYQPAQILGQVLANPLAWQNMDPKVLAGLVQQYGNRLAHPPSIQSMMPDVGGGAGNGLLGMLLNRIGNGGQQSQNPMAQGGMGSGGMPQATGGGPVPQDGTGNALDTGGAGATDSSGNALLNPPSGGNSSGIPDTTANRIAGRYNSNRPGGINAFTTAGAQATGLATTATTEAANQANQYKAMIDDSSQAAEQGQNVLNLLDKAQESYPRLKNWEKGPVFGRLPAVTTAASDTDRATAGIADSVARAQQTGHITQGDRVTYQSIKADRSQPGDSFRHQVDFMRGMNERIQEKPAFLERAQEMGLNPAQANSVWTYYIHQRPFYDAKNNRINQGNINSWEKFLSPQKINEALRPSLRKNSQPAGQASASSNSMQRVRSPKGRVASGSPANIARFLKDHPDWQRA